MASSLFARFLAETKGYHDPITPRWIGQNVSISNSGYDSEVIPVPIHSGYFYETEIGLFSFPDITMECDKESFSFAPGLTANDPRISDKDVWIHGGEARHYLLENPTILPEEFHYINEHGPLKDWTTWLDAYQKNVHNAFPPCEISARVGSEYTVARYFFTKENGSHTSLTPKELSFFKMALYNRGQDHGVCTTRDFLAACENPERKDIMLARIEPVLQEQCKLDAKNNVESLDYLEKILAQTGESFTPEFSAAAREGWFSLRWNVPTLISYGPEWLEKADYNTPGYNAYRTSHGLEPVVSPKTNMQSLGERQNLKILLRDLVQHGLPWKGSAWQGEIPVPCEEAKFIHTNKGDYVLGRDLDHTDLLSSVGVLPAGKDPENVDNWITSQRDVAEFVTNDPAIIFAITQHHNPEEQKLLIDNYHKKLDISHLKPIESEEIQKLVDGSNFPYAQRLADSISKYTGQGLRSQHQFVTALVAQNFDALADMSTRLFQREEMNVHLRQHDPSLPRMIAAVNLSAWSQEDKDLAINGLESGLLGGETKIGEKQNRFKDYIDIFPRQFAPGAIAIALDTERKRVEVPSLPGR